MSSTERAEDPVPVSIGVRQVGSLICAFIRRDWKVTLSYRVGLIAQLIQSLVTLLFLFALGRLVGGKATIGNGMHEGYFPFAVLGVAMLSIVNSELNAVSAQIRNDQTTGTFEALFAMPSPPWMTVLGSVAFQVLWATAVALMTIAIAVGGFGMRFHASFASAGVAMIGLVVAMLLFAALGIGLAGTVVVFKATFPVSNAIATGLSLLGGVYYPIGLLPGPLHVVAEILPFTWALEVLRAGLLQHQMAWSTLALLVAVTLVLVPASMWTFTRAVMHSRRTGALGHY